MAVVSPKRINQCRKRHLLFPIDCCSAGARTTDQRAVDSLRVTLGKTRRSPVPQTLPSELTNRIKPKRRPTIFTKPALALEPAADCPGDHLKNPLAATNVSANFGCRIGGVARVTRPASSKIRFF
jgi:hypothetical protein